MVTVSQAGMVFVGNVVQGNHTRFEKQKTKRNLIFLKETTNMEPTAEMVVKKHEIKF